MSRVASPSNLHAVESLYSEHYGWLHAWLRKKLACPHNASDLAQDTFFRLLSVPLAELTGLKTPRAFLTTTATRLIIDEARRRKVERAYMDALALTQDEAYASPEQHLQTIESLTLIVQMLEGLSAKARQAFMLSRIESLPYSEIAAQLGVSTSMIKQYIATAMAHCYMIVHGPEA